VADVVNLLIKTGPLVLFLGLVASIVLAVVGFVRRSNNKARWLGSYVLGLAVTGAAASFIGTALGIAVFCSSEKMGNLCGLGGVFGSGPLLAGIALAIHAHRRVLAASNAPWPSRDSDLIGRVDHGWAWGQPAVMTCRHARHP
jgi:hypothetical protein